VVRLQGIEEKVAFLSRPEAYPDRPKHVEVKQTHMSWVFLTETCAWKLKKPVRTEYLDFTSPKKRRRNCEREVLLNRRLAPDVYHGVVPLTMAPEGNIQLGGHGKVLDWLVCMRRLPSDRMLDQAIARHTVERGFGRTCVSLPRSTRRPHRLHDRDSTSDWLGTFGQFGMN
jgi:aminoglycoside phosphotransferase family enzyme